MVVYSLVDERGKSNYQRREIIETKSKRKIVAMVLAEKRKLREEMMIEVYKRRSVLVGETKIEMMAGRERDRNVENRTVMMREEKIEETGTAMIEKRGRILVERGKEGEKDKKLKGRRGNEGALEKRRGEIEGETAQRKEAKRREGVERETEKGIGTETGIEGEGRRGDDVQSAVTDV